MDLNHYQQEASKTAIYPAEQGLEYVALGLTSESGEVAGKVKKLIRDGNLHNTSGTDKDIAAELGDVLWYVAMSAYEIGYTLDEIAAINLAKLSDRQERGKLGGSGDDR